VNSYDIDWEFRAYFATAGWRIPTSAAAVPGLQDFNGIEVDFGRFLAAPEYYTYLSAINGLSLASAALVSAVLATAF